MANILRIETCTALWHWIFRRFGNCNNILWDGMGLVIFSLSTGFRQSSHSSGEVCFGHVYLTEKIYPLFFLLAIIAQTYSNSRS